MNQVTRDTRRPSSCARIARAVLMGVTLLATGTAWAAYPEKPITLIVPFPPGGSSDNIARAMAPLMSEKLGQPVVIENVAGAGGVLGTQRTVRATADGYTVLLGSGSELVMTKLLNPAVSYDATRDLSPVVFVGRGPMVLVGKPGLPAETVPELIELAKAKPGALSYGSAGNGTPMHVAGELLKLRANVSMTHVPYRGAGPALVDLMGGQIDVAVSSLSAAQSYIKAGRLKALALTSGEPSELAPGIPAMGKLPGFDGFDLNIWLGLFVPARTPADITQKLQAVAQQVLADPGLRKKLADQGISTSGETGEVLGKFMAAEADRYKAVIKGANIKLE